MSDERDPIRLPMIPEPNLTAEERAELRTAMDDPAFWEAMENAPEPTDAECEAIRARLAGHHPALT